MRLHELALHPQPHLQTVATLPPPPFDEGSNCMEAIWAPDDTAVLLQLQYMPPPDDDNDTDPSPHQEQVSHAEAAILN